MTDTPTTEEIAQHYIAMGGVGSKPFRPVLTDSLEE